MSPRRTDEGRPLTLVRSKLRQGDPARDRRAHRKWGEGLVIPAHVSAALDALSLYGPEVDKACRAKEPEVDMWEAGTLYPRWDQVVALADLTGREPDYFMAPVRVLSAGETSMRFHLRRGETLPPPVYRFTARALAEAARFGVVV